LFQPLHGHSLSGDGESSIRILHIRFIGAGTLEMSELQHLHPWQEHAFVSVGSLWHEGSLAWVTLPLYALLLHPESRDHWHRCQQWCVSRINSNIHMQDIQVHQALKRKIMQYSPVTFQWYRHLDI